MQSNKSKSKVKKQSKIKVMEIDMMRIDPGAIGFTSGFSQEHKYSTVGEQITVEQLTELSIVITTKKDTSVTFWAERIFFCHTYDTSMTIIVTKPGIIIDVVGSYFYDKKS